MPQKPAKKRKLEPAPQYHYNGVSVEIVNEEETVKVRVKKDDEN